MQMMMTLKPSRLIQMMITMNKNNAVNSIFATPMLFVGIDLGFVNCGFAAIDLTRGTVHIANRRIVNNFHEDVKPTNIWRVFVNGFIPVFGQFCNQAQEIWIEQPWNTNSFTACLAILFNCIFVEYREPRVRAITPKAKSKMGLIDKQTHKDNKEGVIKWATEVLQYLMIYQENNPSFAEAVRVMAEAPKKDDIADAFFIACYRVLQQLPLCQRPTADQFQMPDQVAKALLHLMHEQKHRSPQAMDSHHPQIQPRSPFLHRSSYRPRQ